MSICLLLATGNRHKVDELRALLAPHLKAGVELLCAADFPGIESPEESGETFEANALIKARAYARATGLLTLADDSGLVVDALDGRPGVHSARYAATAEGRIARVLEELRGVPGERRTARFECVMALVDAGGWEIVRAGRVEGIIVESARGAHGFGYDPIFEAAETPGRTLAEVSAEEKNAISHRGRAVAAIAPFLREAFEAI